MAIYSVVNTTHCGMAVYARPVKPHKLLPTMSHHVRPTFFNRVKRFCCVMLYPFTQSSFRDCEYDPKVDWVLPKKDEVIALLERHKEALEPDPNNDMWHERTLEFVDFAWCAMATEASKRSVPVDFDLYHQVCCVHGLQTYVQNNKESREAERIARYLEGLPGFDWSGTKQCEDAIRVHSWQLVVLSHVLEDPYKYIPEQF